MHNHTVAGLKKTKPKPKPIQCIATGWGRDKAQGPDTATLLQAQVPLLDNSVCENKYGGSISIRMGHLCAGRLDGTTGTCVVTTNFLKKLMKLIQLLGRLGWTFAVSFWWRSVGFSGYNFIWIWMCKAWLPWRLHKISFLCTLDSKAVGETCGGFWKRVFGWLELVTYLLIKIQGKSIVRCRTAGKRYLNYCCNPSRICQNQFWEETIFTRTQKTNLEWQLK